MGAGRGKGVVECVEKPTGTLKSCFEEARGGEPQKTRKQTVMRVFCFPPLTPDLCNICVCHHRRIHGAERGFCEVQREDGR